MVRVEDGQGEDGQGEDGQDGRVWGSSLGCCIESLLCFFIFLSPRVSYNAMITINIPATPAHDICHMFSMLWLSITRIGVDIMLTVTTATMQPPCGFN